MVHNRYEITSYVARRSSDEAAKLRKANVLGALCKRWVLIFSGFDFLECACLLGIPVRGPAISSLPPHTYTHTNTHLLNTPTSLNRDEVEPLALQFTYFPLLSFNVLEGFLR